MSEQTKSDHIHSCGKVLLLDSDDSRIRYLRNILEFVDYSLLADDDVDSVEKHLEEKEQYTAIMLTSAISDEDCDKLSSKLDEIEHAPALFLIHDEKKNQEEKTIKQWHSGGDHSTY
jgi:PleD family two-component response regulator